MKPKKTKVAMVVSYNGRGFQGLQFQKSDTKTVERELFAAIHRAGGVTDLNANEPKKVAWKRSSRTDKGVSAAANLVSLNLNLGDGLRERINRELEPLCVRVVDWVHVTGGFNAKGQCSSRSYEYLLPSYVLQDGVEQRASMGDSYTPGPTLQFSEEEAHIAYAYRLPAQRLQMLNALLGAYTGTKNHHNLTSRVNFSDRWAYRYITMFSALKTFVVDGLEFVQIRVMGQSFMSHQIRKMIGLATAIMRGHVAPAILLEGQIFKEARRLVPEAPSLGLFLDRPTFTAYDQKLAKLHGSLEQAEAAGRPSIDELMAQHHESLEAWKAEHIHSSVCREEIASMSGLQYVRNILEGWNYA